MQYFCDYQPKSKKCVTNLFAQGPKDDQPEETKLYFISCCLHELQSTA